jgi:hypothetical protein
MSLADMAIFKFSMAPKKVYPEYCTLLCPLATPLAACFIYRLFLV